jgi:hypothetical protein
MVSHRDHAPIVLLLLRFVRVFGRLAIVAADTARWIISNCEEIYFSISRSTTPPKVQK